MEISRHLQNIRPSYIREILRAAKSPDVISLAGGLPASDLLPLGLFSEAMATLKGMPDVFQYGETKGYEPLLVYIKDNYHLSADTESIICNGSQQGLDLIARAYINAGDKVVMEAPSYLGALQVFGLAQATILSVSQSQDGPDLGQLELLFSSHEVKFFYTVPDFHNPTGVCWSLFVREKVAELCQQYGVVLIEDSPYRDIRFNGDSIPMVSSFIPESSIILRSFSKVSAPGIRLGVLSAHRDVIPPMIKVKQAADLHTGQPMQAALLHVLQHVGFEMHMQKIRSTYQLRYQALRDALLHLNEFGCSFDEVEGGMFVWLKLNNVSAMTLANELIKSGVVVVPSNVFYHEENESESALRLNFTHSNSDTLRQAVNKIKGVLAAMN
jgi:DNA-binding transcriptional MocR family regulator